MTGAAVKAAATAAKPKTEESLGVFTLVKETENMKRFERTLDDGKHVPQYVSKVTLEALGDPEAVEVIIRNVSA